MISKSDLFISHADACEKDHKNITSFDIAEFFKLYDRMVEMEKNTTGGEDGK